MPQIKQIQKMVEELEIKKGFSRNIYHKITRLKEEITELEDAVKKNIKSRIAEESIDCLFFVCSILSMLKVDGDKIFLEKYKKNMKRFKGKGLDTFAE